MISEIYIKNFSIIESARVSFHHGFQVLSGETGSGKSILFQAISFALGSRSDSDSIRADAQEASVTLVLDPEKSPQVLERCKELEIDLGESEGLLILRRTIHRAGRSRGYVNDQSVTLKSLQSLGNLLVNLVGQHASQKLLEESYLLTLLDCYAGHDSLLENYQQALTRYHDKKKTLESLKVRVDASREQEDFLRFQFEELQSAGLQSGEEAALEVQKQRLKHRVALATHTFEMGQVLMEGEDSLVDRLGSVLNLSQKALSLDVSLESVRDSLLEALERVQEAGNFLHRYGSDLQEEPEAFDRVEERLVLLHELKRKYKKDESGLIDKLEELKKELGTLEDFDSLLDQSTKELSLAEQGLKKVARSLHESRKKSAKEISGKLAKTLKDLALPHSKISWDLELFSDLNEYKSNGADQMSLFISFNPGEEPRPFEDIISGGELSRLLLALYEILFPGSMFGTFIFDEVDSGVGGGVAELIGRKLRRLSRQAQVFCITHLPQIASLGQWHFSVEKQVKKGRTFTQIRPLNEEERIQEIARMLAGVEVTDQAVQHAKELLKGNAA